MIPFAILAARWCLRLLVLAVCVVGSAALFTAPTAGGSNWCALAVGAAVGFGSWWVAVFDVPKWADGQR